MKTLKTVTLITALLLAIGEIARWWGQWRLLPMAMDELAVSAAMLLAVALAAKKGAAPLLAAWGLFSGLTLGLLVPTLDHLLFGPPKESAVFYAVILAVLMALGVWSMTRALRLTAQPSFER